MLLCNRMKIIDLLKELSKKRNKPFLIMSAFIAIMITLYVLFPVFTKILFLVVAGYATIFGTIDTLRHQENYSTPYRIAGVVGCMTVGLLLYCSTIISLLHPFWCIVWVAFAALHIPKSIAVERRKMALKRLRIKQHPSLS